MERRGAIATNKRDLFIYLHHEGDRAQVETFVAYCAIAGHRPPEIHEYGWARLSQVIANFIDASTPNWYHSLGVGIYRYDESAAQTARQEGSLYIIENWHIVAADPPTRTPIPESDPDFRRLLMGRLVELDQTQPSPLGINWLGKGLVNWLSGANPDQDNDRTRVLLPI
jgi:hypothetical protein